MKKIKKDIKLTELLSRGFKYDKYLNKYILIKENNENWSQMVLEVSPEDRVVSACGTSIDLNKEIKIIEDLIEVSE